MSAPVTGLLGRACGAAAAVAAGGTWRSYCPSWLAMNGREKMFHTTTLNCVALSLAHVAMTGGLGLHNTCENAGRCGRRGLIARSIRGPCSTMP